MLDIICEVHVIMARYTSNVDMFLEEYLIKVHMQLPREEWLGQLPHEQ